jgi:hypothetical protein
VVDINLDRKKEDIHKDIDLLFEVLKIEAKQRKRKPWHSPKRPQFDIYEKIIQVYDMLNESPPKSWSEIAKRIFPDEVHPPEARSKKPRKQESSATPNAINKAMHYAKVAKEMIEEGGWRQI